MSINADKIISIARAEIGTKGVLSALYQNR